MDITNSPHVRGEVSFSRLPKFVYENQPKRPISRLALSTMLIQFEVLLEQVSFQSISSSESEVRDIKKFKHTSIQSSIAPKEGTWNISLSTPTCRTLLGDSMKGNILAKIYALMMRRYLHSYPGQYLCPWPCPYLRP